MARGEQLRAGEEVEGLRRALHWNRVADECFPPATRPRWLGRQRRELAQRLPGESTEAGPESPPTELDGYFDALESASQGKHEQALDLLLTYTERHPRHFVAWYVRGMCHEGLAQHADAAAAFTICISLQPDFPWAHLNRGIVRLKQQQAERAIHDFTRALELKPGWTLALWNRAVAHEARGKLHDAESDLTKALDQPEAPVGLYFLRAKVRRSLDDAAGAERDRAEGMKRPPADALSWNTRGVWRRKENPQLALGDFDAALQLNPRLREALQNKALVLADQLDRPGDAVASLDRLLEMYPNHLEARAGRGVYLARLGESERAIQDANDCLRESQAPFLLYQMAGLYAHLSLGDATGKMRAEALRLLARAFSSGFDQLAIIDRDPDIVPLRDDAEFKRLLEHAQALQAARRMAAR